MLKTVRRILEEVNSASNLAEALDIVARRVRSALETQACSIFLVDHEQQHFLLTATAGLNTAIVGQLRIPLSKGLIGVVGRQREPLRIELARNHPDYYHVNDLGEEVYQAFLGVPIQQYHKLLGIIVVQQEESRAYDDAEEAFVMTVAVQLASVLGQNEISLFLDRHFSSGTAQPIICKGIASVPGIAVGEAVVVYPAADLDAVPDYPVENVESEIVNFEQALAAASDEIRILAERLSPNLPQEEQDLFDVYIRILDSQTLHDEIIKEIRGGIWAQAALKRVIKNHVRQFKAMENEYLRERADDFEDLGQRILAHLQSEEQAVIEYPQNTVLIGEEVSAGNLAEVPPGQLAGVVSARGSASSHVAILARALGIPTIMGVSELPITQLNEKQVIVDGYHGQLHISPDANTLEKFSSLAQERRELDVTLEALRDRLAETQDGYRVGLCVNTGLMADVGHSLTVGADGVGLYRTEVPFMTRDRFPSLEEQRIIYRQLLGAFAPRSVTMRTLDIGGDKPLPYFQIQEENPFLGWRGIRFSLEHPEVLIVQIRAMLKASEGLHNLRIMLPMVSDVVEVEEALKVIHKAYHELKEAGLDIVMPQIGVMVEVPSAVYQARALAQRVDFLSVGSNDLTQYILAVDRNNSRVANLYDSLHPAVLKALQYTVEAAHKEGKYVSICGEIAGDPLGSILLLAMGFDILSMSATSLPRIKWVIQQLSISRARKLLHEVLVMETALEIRDYLAKVLEEIGLGILIRAE